MILPYLWGPREEMGTPGIGALPIEVTPYDCVSHPLYTHPVTRQITSPPVAVYTVAFHPDHTQHLFL